MRLAIAKAEEGIAAGQSPFRAGGLPGGPTAHRTPPAGATAVRRAGAALQTTTRGGGGMYPPGEPCPMCLAATHWSKIDVVYSGAVIADAESAEFTELTIPAVEMVRLGG